MKNHILLFASAVLGTAVNAAVPVVTLTFDDNPKGHLTVAAPVLERYGFRGSFCIVTGTIGKNPKLLDWDDVRELDRRGHEIVSHTVTHPNLVRMLEEKGTNAVLSEMAESIGSIKRVTGKAPRFLCHPGCCANPAVDDVIRSAGLTPMSVHRHNFGTGTTGESFAKFLDSFIASAKNAKDGPKKLDLLFHGVSKDSGGWLPIATAADFEACIAALAQRSRKGLIRVVDYKTFSEIGAGVKKAAVKSPSRDFPPVHLTTPSTSLVFERDAGGTWLMPYYGARVKNAEDVVRLRFEPKLADGRIGGVAGQVKAASYSVYGAREVGIDVNKYGGLCVKHADGVMSTEMIGLQPEWIEDKQADKHLVLPMKDEAYPFVVRQHFRTFADTDAVETWVEISNYERGAVELYRMDSAAIVFPLLDTEFRFLSLTGQWGCESQISETALERGQTVAISSRNGIRDAWFANPAFMLSVGAGASERTGRVLGGVLCWSGAWGISAQRDYADLLEIRMGADNSNGAYLLAPGKTLVTPKAVLVWSESGKGKVSRELHRWARNHRLPHGRELRDIVLNSWEGAYFDFDEARLEGMMDGLKEMGGEMFVVDDGWFGNGRYARDNDRNGLGDWTVNTNKLPRGIRHLTEEAKKRSLKFGLWVEPEMVNVTSELYERHPEWAMKGRTRALGTGRGGTQCVLDLTNPAVVDDVSSQLSKILKDAPDIKYFKWDANANFFNVGSQTSKCDQNIYFDYTLGLYEVLSRLRKERPDLVIQGCSSGGGRIEYGFLGYADEFWPSDDSDARERVFIQWGSNLFYPASAAAGHVTVVPNHQTKRVTPLKYRFDVAMSVRLGLELDPKKMSAGDLAFAKECIAAYKRIRPTVQQGELYRLVSPYGNTYASLMYVAADGGEAVVFLWGLNRGPKKDFVPPLKLEGLEPGAKYRISEINRVKGAKTHSNAVGAVVRGDALMNRGLPVYLDAGDYDSAVFVLEKMK